MISKFLVAPQSAQYDVLLAIHKDLVDKRKPPRTKPERKVRLLLPVLKDWDEPIRGEKYVWHLNFTRTMSDSR